MPRTGLLGNMHARTLELDPVSIIIERSGQVDDPATGGLASDPLNGPRGPFTVRLLRRNAYGVRERVDVPGSADVFTEWVLLTYADAAPVVGGRVTDSFVAPLPYSGKFKIASVVPVRDGGEIVGYRCGLEQWQ